MAIVLFLMPFVFLYVFDRILPIEAPPGAHPPEHDDAAGARGVAGHGLIGPPDRSSWSGGAGARASAPRRFRGTEVASTTSQGDSMPTTQQNLATAFAGESQANRKYLAFARQAEKEGFAQIAKLFRAAAEAETIHALGHLANMGGVGTTLENLEAAVAGRDLRVHRDVPADGRAGEGRGAQGEDDARLREPRGEGARRALRAGARGAEGRQGPLADGGLPLPGLRRRRVRRAAGQVPDLRRAGGEVPEDRLSAFRRGSSSGSRPAQPAHGRAATSASFSARESRFSAASRRRAALRSFARADHASATGRRERV